jgi:hypothetical protein
MALTETGLWPLPSEGQLEGPTDEEARQALAVATALNAALDDRSRAVQRYSDYYNGTQRLVYSTEKWRRAFGGLFTHFSDNWCQLVVDAVDERLDVEGFRFGDDTGDQDAWQIWQRSNLDADSQMAHTAALIYGVAYAMAWWGDDGQAELTVESPENTIVAFEPGSRRKRAWALRRWQADERTVFVTLYGRQHLWKWQVPVGAQETTTLAAGGWQPREAPDEPWPLAHPLGVVPVVPLLNRPQLSLRSGYLTDGQSEIAQVIPVQDAVNKLLLDMIVASEFGAFRQRWVTGMEIPTDPETGQPVEPFRAAVDRLWMAEGPEVKFGEFNATDLSPYTKAVEMLVQHIASQTRTPPHYFYLSGQFPSGESIKAAETGLVAKARRKMRHFEEGWEELMRLGFAIEGDERAHYYRAETIWADPESRTEGEHVDATMKKKSLDVPIQQLWEDLGYSPQQIARFRGMLAESAFLQALAAPVPILGQTGQPAPPPTPAEPASRAA